MRILVISDLPHFVRGGAEMQACRLINAWLDAGHEVRCIGRRMGAAEVEIGAHRIQVARIGTIHGSGRWLRGLSYFLSLAVLLLRMRSWADVVYCRFLGEAAATAALLKAMHLLPCPVVATPANVGGVGDVAHLRSVPGWRRIVRLLDRHVDAINLIAPGLAAELTANGFSGRNFTTIPNGIPVRPLAPRRNDRRIWVLVGRLTPQKAVDVLIEALAGIPVAEHGPEIHIIGDGPERDRLEAMARASPWHGRIRFVGSLPPEAIGDALAGAELFLLPSRYEGMSNAGLEAMERGLPLLLSRCQGLDRYIDAECGWVVPPEDVASLRAALRQALDTPPDRLAAMGAACRRLVESNFELGAVAGRHLELFTRLRVTRSDGRT